MRSNLFLLSTYFLVLFCFSSCSSENSNPFGLADNHIYYHLKKDSERDYAAYVTLKKAADKYQLSIKGASDSDGIIITIKDIESLAPQTFHFNEQVSVIVNEKVDKELNIYVSSGCKNNPGTLEIVNWDESNKTITGSFTGPVCTRGIFAYLPSTEINEGSFYKLKYNVK